MSFNKKLNLLIVIVSIFLGNSFTMAQKAPQIAIISEELDRRESQLKEFIRAKRYSTRSTDFVFLGGMLTLLIGTLRHSATLMGCGAAASFGAIGVQEYQIRQGDKEFIQQNLDYFKKKLQSLEEYCKENEVILHFVAASDSEKEAIKMRMNNMKADWKKQFDNGRNE